MWFSFDRYPLMRRMVKEISFKSHGADCRGRLYEPTKATSNGAGIVLAHGICGTMDAGLFPYAEAFVRAGFHALVFDYRGFGLSDGTPRQYVSVPRQRQDWRTAINQLRSHANVDADRIGLWGMSFSGGHVIHLAHQDASIGAVVAQVPSIDPVLSLNMGTFDRGPEKTQILQDKLRTRMKQRWLFKKAEMLLIAPRSRRSYGQDVAVLAAKEAAVYPKIGGPSWRNEIHPDSFITGKLIDNNPSLLTDDLTTPMLIQLGRGDRCVSNEAIHNFARRCGPLARLTDYEAEHFTMLQDTPARAKGIAEAVGFYKEHLN